MDDCVQPTQTPQRYNLRERATHIINLVIIEETPNITSTVIIPDTGKMLEYRDLIKHDKYKK
eukprot:8336180-Ditylum_brightwellii.AAC.1